jgi:uncharacterized membrane protein
MSIKSLMPALMRLSVFGLAVLVMAGNVHLFSILLIPRLAQDNAYARIATKTSEKKLVMATAPDDLLPFEDPATILAVCRYDLSAGPLRLRGQVGADFLMLFSFHTNSGEVFYAMSDRSALRGRIDLWLATRAQIEDMESNDIGEEPPQDMRLASPAPQGFVLIRTLAERANLMEQARRNLAAFTCEH